MTVNSKMCFEYLKDNNGKELTAQDIAAALDITVNAVTGSVNGLVKNGYAVRNEVEIVNADGKTAKVKYISLTDAGMAFNPDAETK